MIYILYVRACDVLLAFMYHDEDVTSVQRIVQALVKRSRPGDLVRCNASPTPRDAKSGGLLAQHLPSKAGEAGEEHHDDEQLA